MALDVSQRGPATYYDGQTSRKRSVVLRFAHSLEIVELDAVVADWPYSAVRHVDGPPTALLRLGCVAAPSLARLEIEDEPTQQAIALHCTALEAGRSRAQTARIVLWSLAAACTIFVLAVYGIPLIADRLAHLVPQAWERRIGEAADAQIRLFIGGKLCNDPDGEAALESLVDKVKRAGGIEGPLEPRVVSSNTENAFALPGGKIYVLNGILQKAQSPDEIAGILAHELGHVKHRDGLRKLIQTGGTSYLIGLLFGDVTGAGAALFAARTLLDAAYSRDAEREADAFSIETMNNLGRSASAMGELLLRVSRTPSSRAATILSSHPLTEDRLDAMKREQRPVTGSELLTAAQWSALKRICRR